MRAEQATVDETRHIEWPGTPDWASNDCAAAETPLVLIFSHQDRHEGVFPQALVRSPARTWFVSSLEQSMELLELQTPDLVVFDARVGAEPLGDLIRGLRGHGVATPFMVAGAETVRLHILPLLAAGCDSFLEASACRELVVAEASALIRRYRFPLGFARFGDLQLDPASRVVTYHGVRIRLTPREYSLLYLLMRRAERTISNADLEVTIWGTGGASHRDVCKQLVRSLRRKIECDGAIALENVRGEGYRLARAHVLTAPASAHCT